MQIINVTDFPISATSLCLSFDICMIITHDGHLTPYIPLFNSVVMGIKSFSSLCHLHYKHWPIDTHAHVGPKLYYDNLK